MRIGWQEDVQSRAGGDVHVGAIVAEHEDLALRDRTDVSIMDE